MYSYISLNVTIEEPDSPTPLRRWGRLHRGEQPLGTDSLRMIPGSVNFSLHEQCDELLTFEGCCENLDTGTEVLSTTLSYKNEGLITTSCFLNHFYYYLSSFHSGNVLTFGLL